MKANRIMTVIERRLLTPSYIIMLAGLLVRSVALVLSVAIPYNTWPLALRIGVEAFAALGMVGCADIVLSAASARKAQLDRQGRAIQNSDEYQPNPRLSGERFARQKEVLSARRELALAGIKAEATKEQRMMYGMACVTVSYGLLFAFTVINGLNVIIVAVEVIGVAAIPAITWYVSAQYREEQPEPDEEAKAVAQEGVIQRILSAKERFSRGDETEADITLLEMATSDSPYHRKLVASLRRPDMEVTYLSTPDIYKLLGVTDSTGQATIRRIVRRAGERREHGVLADPKSGQWRTPKASLIDLFPQFIGGNAEGATGERTTARKPRTASAPQIAPKTAFSEQISDTARAASERLGGLVLASAEPEWLSTLRAAVSTEEVRTS